MTERKCLAEGGSIEPRNADLKFEIDHPLMMFRLMFEGLAIESAQSAIINLKSTITDGSSISNFKFPDAMVR